MTSSSRSGRGVLGAATGLAFSIAAPFWGAVADKYGRRPMVVRSMLGGALVLSAMGLASSVSQLLVLRIAQGALTGTISASTAMVSCLTPRKRLGFSLGLMQTAVFSGMSLGPLLGGAVADRMGYRVPFYVAGGMLLFSALLVLIFTREHFQPAPAQTRAQTGALGIIRNTPGFTTMLAVFLLVNLAGSIAGPIFPLFVEKLLGPGAQKGTITGLLMAVSGVLAAVAAVGVGHLGDRVGQKKMLAVCTLLSGLCCIPQALATSVGQLFGLRAALGLAGGGTGPTINAIVGRLTPRESFGRVYGLTASVASLGGSVGPLLGGVLASALGLRMPFVITGVMLVLISGLVTLHVKDPRPGKP